MEAYLIISYKNVCKGKTSCVVNKRISRRIIPYKPGWGGKKLDILLGTLSFHWKIWRNGKNQWRQQPQDRCYHVGVGTQKMNLIKHLFMSTPDYWLIEWAVVDLLKWLMASSCLSGSLNLNAKKFWILISW